MSNAIRRTIKNNFKKINFGNFLKLASTVTLAYTISLAPAFSQQIITDGNTNTQLNIVNRTTNVTTSTIKGSNAFNSFVKFNVNSGNVVNLHVPDNTSNLINLVHDETTNINGILNSVKAGKVGGNIFLVNPYGVTVGSQSVVNVGSLTVVTPTHDYMNNFFDAPGNPNIVSVDKLINGQAPINEAANVINQGKINAITNVKIDAGSVINQGEICSGAVFEENDIEVGDIVNLNTLESGSSIAVVSGEIIIRSKNDFVNEGKIIADGGDNIAAGSINITAVNDINLNDGSLISAKGKGENSNGGDVYIYAYNNSYFNNGAIIDAQGGNISGDGGFIELSATSEVVVGGQFKASSVDGANGTVLIDPVTLNINTDQIMPGVNINWTADETITVNGAVVSTRVIGGSTDYANAASTGNSGNVTITSAEIYIQNNSEIYTHADNGFVGGNVTLNANTLDPALPVDALARAFINNSTVKANNISLAATGGNDVGNTYANARVYTQDSTLTADGDIIFTATAGSGLYEAYAEALSLNSTLTSGAGITFTATGGSAAGSRLTIRADARANASDSSLSSVENIELTATGGTATNSIDDLLARVLADAEASVYDSTLVSDENIEFTATGGTATSNSLNPIDRANAYAETKAYNSILTSNDDILLTSTGGTVNVSGSVTMGARAYAETFAYSGSTLSSLNGDIVFDATGGSADDDAYSKVYTVNSILTSADNIEFESEATVAGHDANVDIDVDSVLTAASNERTLVVKADGTIDLVNSNIYAEIAGGVVNVPDIDELNISLTSTQVGGPGTITGSGELNVYDGYKAINITNNSNLHLKLNNMNTAVSGEIIKTGTYTGSFTESTIRDGSSKNITINNNDFTDLELVGEIINPGGDLDISSGLSITANGCLISTRNIGGSTDYANAASIGDSGDLTMTSLYIYFQSDPEVYTHADNDFVGGDVTIDADASALVAVEDAHAEVDIDTLTMKARNLNITATAGNSVSAGAADSGAGIIITDAMFIIDEDVLFRSTGGTANGTLEAYGDAFVGLQVANVTTGGDIELLSAAGTSTCPVDAYANAFSGIILSDLTSGGIIKFVGVAGSATGGDYSDVSSEASALMSNLESATDIEFTAIAGDAESVALDDSDAWAEAYVTACQLTSYRDILFTSTGGVAQANDEAYAYGDSFAVGSDLLANRDIVFSSAGGVSSGGDESYANPCSVADGSTLQANRDILFGAVGGFSTGLNEVDSGASGYVYDSDLISGRDIDLEALTIQNGYHSEIEIDVDSTLTAGSNNRNLLVNADGKVDLANSNVDAVLSGSTLDVGDVEEGNIFLSSTNIDGQGLIFGAGELNVYTGFQSIDIINNSDLGLKLNGMNTAISGEIAKDGNYTGTYTENVIADNTSKDINVTNNGDSNVEFVGDILNSNGNVGLTNKSKLITGTGGLISTRNIGGSIDYANGTSIGNSGNVTLISPLGCFLNNSEIYSHANAGFNGGNVLLNADASSLVGPSFVSVMSNITDSTIKANDINVIAKAGTISDASATAQIIIDNSSLISDGEIEITGTGGIVNYDPASIPAYMALVEVHTSDSIFTSDGKIKITGIGGTGKNSALADVQDHDSTFTSGGNIEFIATGGRAVTMSAAEVGTNGSTLLSGRDIVFTATGGTTTGTASGTDYADTIISAIFSTFTSSQDILFTSTAGTANSRACATASDFGSSLFSGRDIVFTATGGVANAVDTASAFADSSTIGSTLTSLRNIEFNAIGGTANAVTGNSQGVVVIDNSDLASGIFTAFASDGIDVTHNGSSDLTLADITSTTGPINITANNDFIVNPGASISTGASNNAIVLNSLSGNFINNSDANAILAPNGRWLVYAKDPDASSLGSLVHNKQYNVNYNDTPPDAFTKQGNYILYSIAPFLTVVADNKSRTYGSVNPELTISLVGLIGGDTLENAVSGSVNLSTLASQSSNVGSYAINISQGSLLADLGYQFNNFVGGTLTVNKANLIVTADNKSKIYGAENPLFTASYRGFVLGQGINVLGGSLDFETLANKMSMPGTYAIDPFGFTSDNYNIIYEAGTLTVVPGGGPNGLIETLVGSATKSSLDNMVPGGPVSPPLPPPPTLPPAIVQSGSPLPLVDTSGLNLGD